MSFVEKMEPLGDGSLSDSLESSPEQEAENFAQETPATQKRKGGRKPIYATSEERKQRNRQAQAAFRERRTEYIKQLETTIKHHEDTLQTLQQNHRSAADECLMLRYKNSLLERILLEKGIDVQAELRAQTGSPHLAPTNVSPISGPPVMQRAIMNRHNQARRSVSGAVPKTEPSPIPMSLGAGQSVFSSRSPQLHPTPPSHTSSPTSASPGFGPQGVMTPPISDRLAQASQQQSQQQKQPQQDQRARPAPRAFSQNQQGFAPPPPPNSQHHGFVPSAVAQRSSQKSNYYPPTPFQSHMEQLEQEYDAQADMLDEPDSIEASTGPGSFPHSFSRPDQQPVANNHSARQQPVSQPHRPQQQTRAYSSFDPSDPALDADPFGLTASMTFPTPFSFETSAARQQHNMR